MTGWLALAGAAAIVLAVTVAWISGRSTGRAQERARALARAMDQRRDAHAIDASVADMGDADLDRVLAHRD